MMSETQEKPMKKGYQVQSVKFLANARLLLNRKKLFIPRKKTAFELRVNSLFAES